MDCVRNLKMNNTDCLQQCSGMLITSYDMDIENTIYSKLSKLTEYLSQKINLVKDIGKEFKGLKNK